MSGLDRSGMDRAGMDGSGMESVRLTGGPSSCGRSTVENDIAEHPAPCAALLINFEEELQCSSAEELCEQLNCPPDTPVKVVSIFGKTGDGKSHTLNHAFFDGRPVFATSDKPDSCTVGVWAALDRQSRALVLDTEGLQGMATNENQRTRLLLKVLAVSDVILYRIKADRLHNDLFAFLGDASRSYTDHFKDELVKAAAKEDAATSAAALSRLGPAVVVFHETQHTEILAGEEQLRQRFDRLRMPCDAYAVLRYVGARGSPGAPTNFEPLRTALRRLLSASDVRSARPLRVVYRMLRSLNDKFSGQIDDLRRSIFPDEYFTCGRHCVCCQVRCTLSMNHESAGPAGGHAAPPDAGCRYISERDNKVYVCRACLLKSGKRQDVSYQVGSRGDSGFLGLAKYAWSGYVLECPTCGIIHRSRQHWYGNEDPERAQVVQVEVRHVWDDVDLVPGVQGSLNAAQRLLDGVNFAVSSVGTLTGALPTQVITDYISDSIAPSHWTPNREIVKCQACGAGFSDVSDTDKHHCRSCGRGFCDKCTRFRAHVSGYGADKVRVCEKCNGNAGEAPASVTANDTRLRQYSELISTACSTVYSSAAGAIKDFARPSYWQPDDDIKQCAVCKTAFANRRGIHHCRRCGMGVCGQCSLKRQSVPSRGWDTEVRVCDTCFPKA